MAVESEVRIPDIGDFEDVEVIEILVSPGDTVGMEDSLITIESDKASMEIPSPFAGVIGELAVGLGDRVSEGSLVLRIIRDVTDSPAPEIAAVTTAEPAAQPAAADPAVSPTTVPSAGDQARSKPAPGAAHASPSVRHFARELGADLSLISGTGRKGRIVREDVKVFVQRALSGGDAIRQSVVQIQPARPVNFAKYGEIEIEKLNRVRRAAAVNLHRSWVTIPHVTQFDDADITELEEYRVSQKLESERRGVKLTILSFLMKAVVSALKEFPQFCASLDETGENLILKRYYHIGVAVDTSNGLVVPVVRDVDRKGLYELAIELGEVSERARNRKLTPTDLSGGCFSISSLGGIGGTAFTPIVNGPEVAILGVSRTELRPVYREGELTPRLILPLALSYDHRVIDGADAARFTTALKDVLSDVRNLVL